MTTPLISIILPTYNGVKWVKRAIHSVLEQSFSEFELIIIDDGSTDTTNEIIENFTRQDSRIQHIKNERNLGIQKTRNISLGYAKAEYIAEIDQDDVWLDKNKLKKQFQFLKENKEYVLVGTGVVIIDSDGKEIVRYLMPQKDAEIRNKILRMNCFVHSSVMYRKRVVEAVGGYTIEKMSEDHDLWLRLGRLGKFTNLQEYSVQYCFSTKGYNSQDKFIRLKQNLLFAREHKDFYPNYFYAIALGWIKICFYPIFNLMPAKLKGIFLKLHKKL